MRFVQHAGAVSGFVFKVVLVPSRGVGLVVLANADEMLAVEAVAFWLLDRLFGQEPSDWPALFGQARTRGAARLARAWDEGEATRSGQHGPPLPLDRYAGDFVDRWFGPMLVRVERGGLHARLALSPEIEGPLDHWRDHRFRARWTQRDVD